MPFFYLWLKSKKRMIVAISRSSKSFKELLSESKPINIDGAVARIQVDNDREDQVIHSQPNCWQFTSSEPYARNERGGFFKVKDHISLKDLMVRAENNFVGIELSYKDKGWNFIGHSARITRARLYYAILPDTIVFSYDLRDLLPFTDKKLDLTGAYSILKYGDVPEYITCVQGIYSIPVGMYVEFDSESLDSILGKKMLGPSDLQHFFKLDFPMDGGDIPKTQQLLEEQFSFVATLNPLVPISGGVDSTLLNSLIDRYSDEPYPAYYMQFGEDDPELKFAKEAAEGTKAELYVGVFTPDDMIDSFHSQNTKLIQPIGESSTISIAYYFRYDLHHGRKVMDGTLADGCYGSTDYNKNIIANIPNRPRWQQKLNEQIASYLQWNRTKWENRFHPRDSNMPDPYLQYMDVYLGPFGNTLLRDAEKHCEQLLPLWQQYYDYLNVPHHLQDDWMKYSVLKMVNYACKNNTAKSYDNAQPANSGLYPFTWKSILEDQGHYHWLEKAAKGIVKYPLKKILEQYKDHDFIYRKKVGLNSCFEDWIHHDPNRVFLSDLVSTKGGIAEHFLGGKQHSLIDKFQSSQLHPNLAHLVINLSIMQAWMDYNKVTIA
ncbi:MAG: asparagine synthetase B (glutamine-hydrolyzing) [Flavobacteriales bacterium]